LMRQKRLFKLIAIINFMKIVFVNGFQSNRYVQCVIKALKKCDIYIK
jgi:hypothetical protein